MINFRGGNTGETAYYHYHKTYKAKKTATWKEKLRKSRATSGIKGDDCRIFDILPLTSITLQL
jgi:hypothetical protein